MQTRFWRYLLGIVFFSAATSIFSLLPYEIAMWIYMKVSGYTDANFLIYSPLYQIPICFLCSFIAFLFSIFLRDRVKRVYPRSEPYVFLGLGALIANAAGIIIFKGQFTVFHVFIGLASLMTVFVGAKFYGWTWRKIDQLSSD